jgi:pyruvate kinase
MIQKQHIIQAMEYDIIATLGPSSSNEQIWQEMLITGVSGFRLNTSHSSIDQINLWIEKIQTFYNLACSQYPLILDLQGSKWRLGQFASMTLIDGQEISLVYAKSTERRHELPVPHLDFFSSVLRASDEISLNDAKVQLSVLCVEQESIRARVIHGGSISSGKGITYLSSDSRQEGLTDKDQVIVEQTRSLDFIRYAVSYVRDATEMARYRANVGNDKYLIAKLEREPALDQADGIAEQADELWLCRGDLGAELGDKAMAEAVHRFAKKVPNQTVPVILAGQVLEHMTKEATPTRSEICYLYEALELGYRGFVLSDETSIGKHPLASCRAAALFRTGNPKIPVNP